MLNFRALPVGRCLPPSLSGFAPAKTYAPWPVWSDSTTQPVRFQPVARKEAARLWHRARDFERQTRQPGHQDGALGRNGLAVLHALLFDFLNYRTGQLDPAYEAIARAACISVRSVARGLQALKAVRVLFWQRRASARVDETGAFLLEQESNAYGVCPPSQWKGYAAPLEAPPPDPGTWGDHPCAAREPLTEAVAEIAVTGSASAVLRQLEADPDRHGLAAVLARLGRAVMGVESPRFSESARLAEKHA